MKQFIFIASFLLLLISGWRYMASDHQPQFATLCSTCPPGFELDDKNRCRLRSLYQMYENKDGNNPGVGGLKTALPAVRDGFTPQQIDLGRYLFFDPVLSADGTVSCASCHQPDKGFSDGLRTSVGITHIPLKRAAPSLWNVAFLKNFFWGKEKDYSFSCDISNYAENKEIYLKKYYPYYNINSKYLPKWLVNNFT